MKDRPGRHLQTALRPLAWQSALAPQGLLWHGFNVQLNINIKMFAMIILNLIDLAWTIKVLKNVQTLLHTVNAKKEIMRQTEQLILSNQKYSLQ
jgi:hypothetical protein